jgi:hypothetical protein
MLPLFFPFTVLGMVEEAPDISTDKRNLGGIEPTPALKIETL